MSAPLSTEVLVLAALTAVAVSFATTRLLARGTLRGRMVDVPNERSLHLEPTPRGGGVGILAGVLAGLGVLVAVAPLPQGWPWAAGAVALLAVVSLLDDLRSLPASLRLVVHVSAACLLLPAGVAGAGSGLPGAGTLPPALAVVTAVLFLVWMSNLYNFMDGMDGFAGGMAVIGFGCFAALGLLAGALWFTAVSLLIAAASAGFLAHNFPPARIFMGDVGSIPLGFSAGALMLLAQQQDIFDLWIGVLVFSPFVVDASVTLLRRALGGEAVWRAHRSHWYQTLVRSGWGHRRTVLWEYALMIACAASALLLAAIEWPALEVWVGLSWVLGYTVIGLALARHRRRNEGAERG